MSDTTTVDFSALADQYQAQVHEAKRLGSDERREARSTRDAERAKLREAYEAAIEAAQKAHDEAKAAADAPYNEIATRTDAQRKAAVEEIKKSFVANNSEGLTAEQAKVMAFMITGSDWWQNYPQHCREILQAMPFANYEELSNFGNTRGWCGTYEEFLTAAMAAGVFDVDATEFAKGKFTRALNSYVGYHRDRQAVQREVDNLVAVLVAEALKAAEKNKVEDTVNV